MPLPKLIALLALFLFPISQRSLAQAGGARDFYLYEDTAKTLTEREALQLYKQGKFTPATTNEKNVGFTRSVFWLVYNNKNELPHDSLLLFIGHHHINRIHLYVATDTSMRLEWLTGDYFPFKQRPVNARSFYFPVNKKGLYLARIDKSNESLQLSFAVISHNELLATEGNQKSIMGIFTGMILLLIIFGVYLFFISGDKIYLFYILYMASGWLWVLANAGYGFQYGWPGLPWFASKARPVFALAPLIFSMLFLRKYIGGITNKKMLLSVKIVNWSLAVCIAAILLFNEAGYQSSWWFYIQYFIPLISLVFVVVTIVVLVSAAWRGNKMAFFYLAAISVLFCFAFLQISFSLGTLSDRGNFFSNFGLSIGYIIEAIILTAGLVYRFNQYRLDKENLLVKINRQQHENTRIIIEVQEAERSQVANQLHDVAGSLLSAAKLNLSSYREKQGGGQTDFHLEKTEEAIGLVSSMVRNLSHALSPLLLEKIGFKASLEKIVAIVNASGKIKIELLVTGFETYELALNKYYTALYNIIYELLNNIVKHSGAKNVLLQVTNYEHSFLLVSEDDGIGMDRHNIGNPNSFGLAGIHSKIDYFKGHIAFDANQPSGLIVTIEIPYNYEEI
jgi:signal transduction histidine kinase